MRISRFITLSTVAALVTATAGCAGREPSDRPVDGGVALKPFEALRVDAADPAAAACTVGFELVYPPDIPTHSREILYRYGLEMEPGKPVAALQQGGGPLELPRPTDDPRASVGDQGNIVFRVELNTFKPCRTANGTAMLEIIIGECVAGDCPPMTYQPADRSGVAVIRQADP